MGKKFQISIVALSSLLLILRLYNLYVPKDPRTLLKTPLNYSVEHVAGGDYFYYGIKKGILSLLKHFGESFPLTPILSLQRNVDGLPLFKSSKLQLWPILGLIEELKQLGPFVIALFSADKKPSLREYLSQFVEEMKYIEKMVLVFLEKFLQLNLMP